jgi:hypothetical protein
MSDNNKKPLNLSVIIPILVLVAALFVVAGMLVTGDDTTAQDRGSSHGHSH